MQRDQDIGAAHELHQIIARQGPVDEGDAGVAGAFGIDPGPDPRLCRVVDAAAVVGLEQQPRRGIIGEGRPEGRDRGERVLARDEGEAVKDRQREEIAAARPRGQRPPRGGAGGRFWQIGFRQIGGGQADADDGAGHMGRMGGDTVIGGDPDFIHQREGEMVAGGGAVEFPEDIGDVARAREDIRQHGHGQRQGLGVQVQDVDMGAAGRPERLPQLAGVETRGGGIVEVEIDAMGRDPRRPQGAGRGAHGLAQPRGLVEGADELHRHRGTGGEGMARGLEPMARRSAGGKAHPGQIEAPRPHRGLQAGGRERRGLWCCL